MHPCAHACRDIHDLFTLGKEYSKRASSAAGQAAARAALAKVRAEGAGQLGLRAEDKGELQR